MSFDPVDLGDPNLNREANMLLAELDDSPPAWWWLSFIDATRPKGDRWVGGCYVFAPNVPMAMKRAWDLKINPGGEVASLGPFTEEEIPSNAPRDVLLDRQTIERLGDL